MKLLTLTNEQFKKGVDMTLSTTDFPEAADDQTNLIEAFKTFPWFFIETFQSVKDVDGTIMPFKLTKPQRYLERIFMEQQKYHNYVHAVVLKGRQYRITTYVARRGLHFSLWNNHIYTIFANRVEDIANEGVFSYAFEGFDSLKEQSRIHPFLVPLIKTSREKVSGALLQFDGLSKGKIEVRPATKDAVGRPCQFAHITEASRIDKLADFWESFYPALHKSAFHHCIVESTARHTGPKFMEIFKEQWHLEQETGKVPSFKAIFIPPYMVDEYFDYELPQDYSWDAFWQEENEAVYGQERDIASQKWWDDYDKTHVSLTLNFMKWRRDMIQGQQRDDTTGFSKLDLFKQNFPMTIEEAELITGDNVFDRKLLDRRRYSPCCIPPMIGDIELDEAGRPEFTEGLVGDLKVWSYPEPDCWYTIGIDPSSDRQGDYNVGVVWSPLRNEIAAMFRCNQWTVHELAEFAIATGTYYNNAMIAYEANYYGHPLLKKFLAQDQYPPKGAPYANLYKRNETNKKWAGLEAKNPVYGFWTDKTRKMALVGILQDLLADDESGLYSEDLIWELWFWRNVMDKDGNITKTPQAPKGKHDDIIIATGIAVYIANEYMKRHDLRDTMKLTRVVDPEQAYTEAWERIRSNKAKEKERRKKWAADIRKTLHKSGVRVR